MGQTDLAYADIRTAVQLDPRNTDAIDAAQRLVRVVLKPSDPSITIDSDESRRPLLDSVLAERLTRLQSTLRTVTDGSDTAIADFVRSPDLIAVLRACDPAATPDERTLALVILSRLFNHPRAQPTIAGAASSYPMDLIKQTCAVRFVSVLDSTRKSDRALAFAALSAIFQTGPVVGAFILNQEGILEEVADCVELESPEVQLAAAEALALACSDRACRQGIAIYCGAWLARVVSIKDADERLRAAAAVAITKMTMVEEEDEVTGQGGGAQGGSDAELAAEMMRMQLKDDKLADLFKDLIKNPKSEGTTLVNAVEGLAYSSLNGSIKDKIATDPAFLQSLFSIAQRPDTARDAPLLYGIATILANVTAYRPVMTDEQRQLKRLRDLANAKNKPTGGGKLAPADPASDPRDDEPAVSSRCVTLVQRGVIPALTSLAKSPSDNTRLLIAQTLLHLTTPQNTRGAIVQQGGVKLLLVLTLKSSDPTTKETAALAAQALAKIAITTDPRVAFNVSQRIGLVRPFLSLIRGDRPLPCFEALMALTNLASVDSDCRARVHAEDGLTAIEAAQFSDNTMVCRAATELLCNMMFCEPVFDAFADPDSKAARNRIKLLLALSDMEDALTRRAASGTLAILAASPGVCTMIVAEPRGLEIVVGLVGEEEGIEVQHRGAEIMRCLVEHGGKEQGEKLVERKAHLRLAALVKECDVMEVKAVAMEALKIMAEKGVKM